MIKQTLFFSSPAFLSIKYNQVIIRLEETNETITRPIEDIGIVIVENQRVNMTVPLLSAFAENNVVVVFCNEKYMPSSMLMPLESNSVQQEVYRAQIDASLPTKKRIWKEIVEYKIRNQGALLDILGLDGNILKPYWSNVLSGDSSNREGVAAKIYWKEMYGKQFIRDREGEAPNSMLNYGYAVLRAAVTRALLGSGLFPGFGLFHRNRYNAFPLADDVMEPYRPFVDKVVNEIFHDSDDLTLTKGIKQKLIKVLTSDVKLGEQTHPLQIAITSTTASLVRALSEKGESIVYPTFV